MDLGPALDVAIAAAREAGDVLRRDFHRPGGPRGKDDKAEADHEAEEKIRTRLQQAFPDWGYLGEETGAASGQAGRPVWLVDPNDGTRDYLKGRRGSAVSIGLLASGRPALGVVFAFAYPDGAGDLIAWAEGCGPLRRNGTAVSGNFALLVMSRARLVDGSSTCAMAPALVCGSCSMIATQEPRPSVTITPSPRSAAQSATLTMTSFTSVSCRSARAGRRA